MRNPIFDTVANEHLLEFSAPIAVKGYVIEGRAR